jgi:hypothetical protein
LLAPILRVLLACSVASTLALAGGAIASAATPPIAIDTRAPKLVEGEDGAWTVALAFTNLTDTDVDLAVEPTNARGGGCRPTLDKERVPESEGLATTLTVPAGCEFPESGFRFDVTGTPVGGEPAAAKVFDVKAAPKPEEDDPDWDGLWAFPVAFGVLAFLGVVAFGLWRMFAAPAANQVPALKKLEATWSFKESWVSNVTVLGALLTGIFGSTDVVTAFLGDDGESVIALAAVGVAIAAAFVAAGPIVILTTRAGDGTYTVVGLLAASVVTLTGAVGELWVVAETVSSLVLCGVDVARGRARHRAPGGLHDQDPGRPAESGAETRETETRQRHDQSGADGRRGAEGQGRRGLERRRLRDPGLHEVARGRVRAGGAHAAGGRALTAGRGALRPARPAARRRRPRPARPPGPRARRR